MWGELCLPESGTQEVFLTRKQNIEKHKKKTTQPHRNSLEFLSPRATPQKGISGGRDKKATTAAHARVPGRKYAQY